jgi:hypothetical protein
MCILPSTKYLLVFRHAPCEILWILKLAPQSASACFQEVIWIYRSRSYWPGCRYTLNWVCNCTLYQWPLINCCTPTSLPLRFMSLLFVSLCFVSASLWTWMIHYIILFQGYWSSDCRTSTEQSTWETEEPWGNIAKVDVTRCELYWTGWV